MVSDKNAEGFWESSRICVTGGAGFLGSYVLEKLGERGASDIFVPHIEEYDLVQLDGVRRMLDDARPDLVIHLAANSHVDASWESALKNNIEGTRNVYECSRIYKIKRRD